VAEAGIGTDGVEVWTLGLKLLLAAGEYHAAA
jgi:hypothetical protein